MSIIGASRDPLPYQPIKIIDVSPYRSSLVRRRPARQRPLDRARGEVLAVAAGIAFLLALSGVAAAGSPGVASFDLAPGHATPPSLVR